MKTKASLLLFSSWLVALAAGCGPPTAIPADEVVKEIGRYYGKRIAIRTGLNSGARCRIGEEGEWKTYCKDCQYCRGPYVISVGTSTTVTEFADDWPMILGGTWEGKDIRCKGPLNKVECSPFELGKQYIIQGILEAHRPPRLIVEKFWPVP